ncbi:MAG TPA: beta-ketoacyl-[acyl-carrier-protein] synthase family protein [Sandaracinaceae bacterium LLY-WYZ-13_1]|nr:beta-ketoacyl-[acyl-carrier-protein] synthase family protein [Sandaracinaceae bacterium LLY-WYZ-13_1]
MTTERRVVITGLGLVSPLGADVETSWKGLLAGECGIRPIAEHPDERIPVHVAGECLDFDPLRCTEKKKLREGGRFIHLSVDAADQAVRQAGLDAGGLERAAVLMGIGMGSIRHIEDATRLLDTRGPRRVSPYLIPAMVGNLAAGQVAIRFGCRGPNLSTTAACTSGAMAIGEAMWMIRNGRCDVALAGGAESSVDAVALAGFASLRAASKAADPADASCPYDRRRNGFVLAEGAAVLALEELEHARRRGAPILAELRGYATQTDAHHIASPDPDGVGLRLALEGTLADAALPTDAIGYVNGHATSTPVGDATEAAVVGSLLPGVAVSSTKGATGHALGGAGAVEAVFSVLALRDGALPATLHLEEPDPACDGIDLVRGDAREAAVDAVLSISSGFGGSNAGLVFARP